MKVLKTIILVLLALLFIVYGLAFMTYRGIDATLVSQDYYRSVVEDFRIPRLIREQLMEMIPEIVRDGLTGGAVIDDPMMKAAIESQVELISMAMIDAFDEKWIADQAALVTNDLVQVLDVKAQGSFSAVIEIEPKLAEIEKNIAQGLEAYSDQQLLGMFGAPKAFIPMIAQQIVSQLGLPERLVISELVDEMAPGSIQMVRSYLIQLNTWLGFLILILVSLVFLGICILFFKLSFGLLWFGISAVLSGGLFLFLKSHFSNLSTISTTGNVDFSSLPVSSDTIQGIITFTFSKMNLFPIIFLASGIAIAVIGLLLARNREMES